MTESEAKKFEIFDTKKVDHNAPRERWSNSMTFVIAAIGSAIGLGNFWRFPYLCYKYGGAFFLIPYLLSFFFLGLPMLMLEFCIGQITQKSAVNVWTQLHPRLSGIGIGRTPSSARIRWVQPR